MRHSIDTAVTAIPDVFKNVPRLRNVIGDSVYNQPIQAN